MVDSTDDLSGITNLASSFSCNTLNDNKTEGLKEKKVEQPKSKLLDKEINFSSIFTNLDNKSSDTSLITSKKSRIDKFINSEGYRNLDVIKRCVVLDLFKVENNLSKIEGEYLQIFGVGWQNMLPKDLEDEYFRLFGEDWRRMLNKNSTYNSYLDTIYIKYYNILSY